MADGPLENVVQELHRIAGLTEAAGMADGRLLEVFTATSEPAALEVLVRRHGPMVLGVCRRVLRHTQDAEDAFQATFLVLVRKAAGLKRGEAVGNWLYGVAYRTALQTRTRSARRSRIEAEVPPMDAEESTVETAARLEMQALLDRELNRLPDKYRAPIILCDLLGKTKKQAAVELRCPEGTVSSRLARGRELLKKRLEHHAPTFAGAAVPLTVLGQTMTQAMPAGLCVNTVKAVVLVANGTTMASLSPSVAAIVQGVMKSMLITKLKPAVMLFVGFGLLSGMTFVVASGMGVGNGPGDVADKGKVEKLAPAVVVAEREAPAVAEVQPPKKQEQAKEDLLYDGKDFDTWRKLLVTELKPERQIEAIHALEAFGASGYLDKAAAAILEVMKKSAAANAYRFTERKGVVYQAQLSLLRLGPAVLATMAKEMESDKANDRRLVMETFFHYADDKLDVKLRQPLFLKGLKDKDTSVRNWALTGIVSSNSRKWDLAATITSTEKQALVPILMSVLESGDDGIRISLNYPPLRECAAIVLAWLGPDGKAAVPLLIKVLEEDKSPELQARAADAIGCIGPAAKDAVPALVKSLAEFVPDEAKAFPTQDFGAKGGKKGGFIGEKRQPLNTPAEKLVVHVLVALGRIGPDASAAIPELTTVLKKINGVLPSEKRADHVPPPAVTQSTHAAAIYALARIGKVSVPALTRLMGQDQDIWLSKNAIHALGQIGPDAKDAVPALIEVLNGDNKRGTAVMVTELLLAAANALGNIGPAADQAIPRLIEIRDADSFNWLPPAELRQLKEAAVKALEKIQK